MVNWNGREQTLTCLSAIEQQLGDVENALVTVVDNGSTDGSIAAITSRFPRFRFIPLGMNRGFTGGLAAALATSRARNVVFLNNDAVPAPGWLAVMQSSIERAAADVISVAGKIIDLEGKRIDFIGGLLTFDGHALQNGFRMPLGSQPEPAAGDELLFACGGNMISRREPLMDLGAFDDDYFAYLEDVDFGWRSWISGCRVTYAPDAVVGHASSATSERLGNFERGVLFERNALQTVIKNYEDDLLSESAGAIFYTYLARLHHYATTRNRDAEELRRSASTSPKRSTRTVWQKIRRRLRGERPLAAIDDPLTAMQFRAFDWIVRNQQRLIDKRNAVQERRRRSDREIFERFPLHVVPTYPGDAELMSGPLFRLLQPSIASTERKLGDIIRT